MYFPLTPQVLSLTVVAGAYAINQVVGTKQTIADPVPPQHRWGRIRGVVLRSATLLTGIPFKLYCFRKDPSASTITNNAAFVMHATDQPYCFGVVQLNNISVLAASSIHESGDISKPFYVDAADPNALYFVLVANGAPTFAGTADLSCTVYVETEQS